MHQISVVYYSLPFVIQWKYSHEILLSILHYFPQAMPKQNKKMAIDKKSFCEKILAKRN